MTSEAGPQVPQLRLRHRFQLAREQAGLSQEELAEEIAVSPRTISRYETGAVTHPRRNVRRDWAHRCNVPVEWLAEDFEHGGGGAAGGARQAQDRSVGDIQGVARWAASDSNRESAGLMLCPDWAPKDVDPMWAEFDSLDLVYGREG